MTNPLTSATPEDLPSAASATTAAVDPATSDALGAGSPGQGAPATPRRQRIGMVRMMVRNRKALFGLCMLCVFILLAVLAPVIRPGDPSIIGLYPLGQEPSIEHLLGTTTKGQDVLALTLWGARSSLSVGFVVGICATLVAALVGLASAYFGGVADDLLSVLTNVFLLVPSLPLLVILAAFMPPGAATVMFVLVITGWAGAARVVRSQALSIRAKDFVAACLVTGERPVRIMFREILPNMASIMMSTFLSVVIGAIGAQAGLEFLGLGDSSVVSWGTNLYWASNDGALMKGQWWVFIPSGLCIALVAFSLAMLNYAVDEVTNPRLRTVRATPSTPAVGRRRRPHRGAVAAVAAAGVPTGTALPSSNGEVPQR